MPEDIAPPQLPDVNLESEPFKFGGQTVEDAYALKLVKQEFFHFESYRRMNHDPRWNGNDALYCAYLPAKTWEGTKIPKASLSQPLCFYQIETALPIIEQTLFGSEDAWFQVEPEPGGDPNEARAIKDHLAYLLDHDGDDFGRTARREIVMAIKSTLMYGNGGITTYWDPSKKRPCVEWVDIRDIYTDPGLSSPACDEGSAVIRRTHYTVEELDAMRGQAGMSIPPKEVLFHMSRLPYQADSDRTKTMQEAFRGVNYVPGQSDYSTNPADRKVEVLIYQSPSRIIWVLGREWVGFNGPNPYKFIQYDFAPCFNFLSRFYAMGYPDVLEGSQRYSEALYNARLNELSLALNPPKVKKPGALMTPNQERWFPGAVWNASNPKEDIAVQNVQNQTANIMSDVDYILQTSEKITGANSMVAGVPSPGNVNRTATGVSTQTQGGSSRIYTIIKNLEDYLIVPMLYKMYKLIQFHTKVEDMLPALGQNDQLIQIGAKAFQAPMRFKMIAASRMMSREKLLQVLPVINQYFLNGAFLQQLHSAGKTVDFDEFQELIQDATATARQYRLIRPMNQQEQQALNQPNPQLVQQKQIADQDAQTRKDLMDKKVQGMLQDTMLKKQPDPAEAQQKQFQMALDAHKAQQDAVQQQQQTQTQMVTDAIQKRQELEMQNRQHQEELHRKQTEHNAKLHQQMQLHQQKLRHAEEQNAEKIKAARILTALKAQEAMQPPAPTVQQ